MLLGGVGMGWRPSDLMSVLHGARHKGERKKNLLPLKRQNPDQASENSCPACLSL